MPEVKLVNVTKMYGRIAASDHINLTINDGEYVSIIGPSGCGKTTLIKNIAGILRPDEGEVYIGGECVTNLPIEERRIGYVFQSIALFPHMTVWDNIVYGLRVRGWSSEEIKPIAIEMLELIKLSARLNEYPNELSSGTQQKTAVARALTSKPDLLLLDEPLSALDIKVRAELRYELKRLVKELNLTALHVTHDQEEAMSISDRVIVMKSGRIVEAGTPLNLYLQPRNIFTANFVGEANFLEGTVAKIMEEGSLIEVGDGLHLMTTNREVKVGDEVVVAFRPDFVSINEAETVNRLSGEVIDLIYSGNIGRIRLKLANSAIITVKIVPSLRPIFQVGDEIKISITPKYVLAYLRPREGLSKELALE